MSKPDPANFRANLDEAYRQRDESSRQTVETNAKLVADRVLSTHPHAASVDFEGSDDGVGLWAVSISGAGGETADDCYFFDDEIIEAMRNLPWEAGAGEWLDRHTGRLDLRAAAALDIDTGSPASFRACLDTAYMRDSAANCAVINASALLAAHLILTEHPSAVYLDFENSDQGDETRLFPVTTTDANGDWVGYDDDFPLDVIEALGNMPQARLYALVAPGTFELQFTDWLDYMFGRTDLAAASTIQSSAPAGAGRRA